jgi:hypothetical protein
VPGSRLLLAMVVSAGLLAGCSSGGADAASATTTSTAEPGDGTTTTTPPAFEGDAGSPFCEVLRNADPSTVPEADPTDPAAVESSFAQVIGMLHDALAVAPPEIEPDLTLVTQGMEQLDATLAQVSYDFEALAASGKAAELSTAVNDPAFAAAGARLSAYRGQVCGL